MFRHALLLVYLVSSAAVATQAAAHFHYPAVHPGYFYHPYVPPPQPTYFRSPFFHYYQPAAPTYFAPAPPPARPAAVTPGSDVVVQAKNLQDDSTVVVEAAPAPTPDAAPKKNLIDPAVISPGLVYSAKSSTPDVITQGMHLGNVAAEGYAQDGYGEDAPAATFTQGPQPGAYTAVSSDEQSEGTLFQSQDGDGNILFGYSSPLQARLESRALDGSVRGSYSYIDPTGRTVKVRYAAGRSGFQVFDDDAGVLPQQVRDTPEVEAAKALHARLYQQAKVLAERPETPSVEPVEDEPSKQPADAEVYDTDDKFHPPDSLYAVGDGLKGVEEDLEYYGAAKGQHMVYAAQFDGYNNEQQHLRRATPLSAQQQPQVRLSPFSAPSFREQQHLHRGAKSLKFDSPGRTVPVVVGVAQQDEAPSTRTALEPPAESRTAAEPAQQHAVPPASISQKANFFGAVPVAAVHDAQVSPAQRVQDHQTKPVYIEAN